MAVWGFEPRYCGVTNGFHDRVHCRENNKKIFLDAILVDLFVAKTEQGIDRSHSIPVLHDMLISHTEAIHRSGSRVDGRDGWETSVSRKRYNYGLTTVSGLVT